MNGYNLKKVGICGGSGNKTLIGVLKLIAGNRI